MSEDEVIETSETPVEEVLDKFEIRSREEILHTIILAIFGSLLYLVLETLPMPYLTIGLIPLGILPSLAIVSTFGAIRGPLAGLLTGYIGVLLSDLILNGTIVAFSLYGLAIGVLGLIVGIGNYEITNGRSLAKISVMSVIGLSFTALLTAVFGIFVEGVATLVVIAFQLLPLLTLGLPSVFLLTPLFARVWHSIAAFISNLKED
ncbi:MAG: hypothetical protein ACXAEF_02100 [Candidatus Thorarchaeota archaeon]|jgi:uncharacterized membrane protein